MKAILLSFIIMDTVVSVFAWVLHIGGAEVASEMPLWAVYFWVPMVAILGLRFALGYLFTPDTKEQGT
jgi:hypothetical protein